jgi:hypothetical protein
MATLFDDITVATFKETFYASFIFEYSNTRVYNRNERAFVNNNALPVYQSIIFDNQNDVSDTNAWNVITSSQLQDICISDGIIQKHIDKLTSLAADPMFLKLTRLCDTSPTKIRAYYLYVAYSIAMTLNLTLDKNNFSISTNGLLASTSDGSNSVAFNASVYASDPLFQRLSASQFGIELYLLICSIPNFLNTIINSRANDF